MTPKKLSKYELYPAPGYMVIKPISEEVFNKTELATLEDEKERISTGEVIAVSEFAGTYENYGFQFSTEAKKGDTVVYRTYTEQAVKLNGEDYSLVRFDNILATIKESK